MKNLKAITIVGIILMHLFWYVSFSKANTLEKIDQCARRLGFKRPISLYKTLIEVSDEVGTDPYDLLVIAVLESSINPEIITFNKNQTYDVGLLGVNSRTSETYCVGINIFNEKDAIRCGAMILKRRELRAGYMWQGAYHSFTPERRVKYYNKYRRLRDACR